MPTHAKLQNDSSMTLVVLPDPVLAFQTLHRGAVVEDQRNEDIDGALLSEPEAEWCAADGELVDFEIIGAEDLRQWIIGLIPLVAKIENPAGAIGDIAA